VPYLESAAREGAPPLTLALLSFACAQTGRMDEAVSVATAAGARGIADPAADLLFGRAMLAAQHITDAEQFFSRAAQLAPSDPEPVTRLGIAKAAEGKSGDAERLFRRALVLKAAYPPAEQALAALRAAGPADRGNP
jgi:Flp pilus assembly protein TadD